MDFFPLSPIIEPAIPPISRAEVYVEIYAPKILAASYIFVLILLFCHLLFIFYELGNLRWFWEEIPPGWLPGWLSDPTGPDDAWINLRGKSAKVNSYIMLSYNSTTRTRYVSIEILKTVVNSGNSVGFLW